MYETSPTEEKGVYDTTTVINNSGTRSAERGEDILGKEVVVCLPTNQGVRCGTQQVFWQLRFYRFLVFQDIPGGAGAFLRVCQRPSMRSLADVGGLEDKAELVLLRTYNPKASFIFVSSSEDDMRFSSIQLLISKYAYSIIEDPCIIPWPLVAYAMNYEWREWSTKARDTNSQEQ